jgi:hypothetical protein
VTGAEPPEDRPGARTWWRALEPIHALTYFAPESLEALRDSGLRGFWMGYFAARVAPLGAVGPAAVAALFFNFHPAMVGRSVPDAWTFADPATVLAARGRGAARALRRLDPSAEVRARRLVPLMERVVQRADGSGRVLFSANRALGRPDDPVEALWQVCTCLREHRGDGHVAALTAAGLDGCEALVLFALSEGLPAALFQESRGWSAHEWESARSGLEARGLLRADRIAPAGLELRRAVEQTTDDLAAPPFGALEAREADEALASLRSLARAVADGGDIPFPNPMGLPAPGPA